MTATDKHSILVVDDEPEILYSLRGLLRRDFEVFTAESGVEAVELLHRQQVHVVMTDQRMPGMTGVQLLSRVRGQYPQAVRIVFTGYADIKAVVDAINQGQIFRYLTKPWDPDELVTVLREACAEHDRIVERESLFTDLLEHLNQGMELVRGQRARDGAAEQSTREQFVRDSRVLLARLNRVLSPREELAAT